MRVAELWRYPVKSLRGESLDRAPVLADGLLGDRLTRVLGPGEREVTARTARALLALQAGLGEDGEPTIDGHRWDSDLASELLQAAAGEGAHPAPLARHFDAAPILVVTDGAADLLGEDRRRLRPNIVVEGVEALTEREWVGERLRVGGAELRVRKPCERCVMTTIDPDTLAVRPDVLQRINSEFSGLMGMYCDVAVAGEVAVGDAVDLP